MAWADRLAIFLKAADLIAGPHRMRINAATMLGQGKNVYQAEIEAACESADFLRFYCWNATRLFGLQPFSSAGVWNQMEYRPLEGFVFAISPFNFTALGVNLAATPALLGNTVIWKPASSAVYSAYHLMRIFHEAGLPDGVINFLPGPGSQVGPVLLKHPDLAGVHFTGSTEVFREIWKTVGATSTTTAATRGWWGRPAARILSSPTPLPTHRPWPLRWCAALSNTRDRSVRRHPGPTFRNPSGNR